MVCNKPPPGQRGDRQASAGQRSGQGQQGQRGQDGQGNQNGQGSGRRGDQQASAGQRGQGQGQGQGQDQQAQDAQASDQQGQDGNANGEQNGQRGQGQRTKSPGPRSRARGKTGSNWRPTHSRVIRPGKIPAAGAMAAPARVLVRALSGRGGSGWAPKLARLHDVAGRPPLCGRAIGGHKFY